MDNPTAGRQRQLLTDLSINLASGVIVAGAVKVYTVLGSVSISPWLLWAAALAAVIVGMSISVVRYVRRPKQVFILVSAFVQKHWVNKLVREFVVALGQHDLDLVLKAPIHDYSGHGQVQQLIRMRRRSRGYAGGFIMVTDAGSVEADLARFAMHAKYPIVFLDQRPFTSPERYPRGTAFVGCHPAEIGRNAADWVAQTFKQQRIRRPGVLVVGSNEHKDRQESFVAALRQHIPGAVITVSHQGLFDRERCKEIVEHHVQDLSRRGEHLHIVFCTNDEMALGAVDAIQERIIAGDACDRITVVGVDGTDEALAVIRSGGCAFRATVEQDSRKVADVAVQQLLNLRAGQRVEVETFVPTNIYPMMRDRRLGAGSDPAGDRISDSGAGGSGGRR